MNIFTYLTNLLVHNQFLILVASLFLRGYPLLCVCVCVLLPSMWIPSTSCWGLTPNLGLPFWEEFLLNLFVLWVLTPRSSSFWVALMPHIGPFVHVDYLLALFDFWFAMRGWLPVSLSSDFCQPLGWVLFRPRSHLAPCARLQPPSSSLPAFCVGTLFTQNNLSHFISCHPRLSASSLALTSPVGLLTCRYLFCSVSSVTLPPPLALGLNSPWREEPPAIFNCHPSCPKIAHL